MFEELRKKYAHFVIKKKFLAKSTTLIDFKNSVSSSTEFLVILPAEEKDFIDSLEVVKQLKIKQKHITLFISELKYEAIPSRHEFKFLSYHPAQISKFFLPTKSLVERLKGKQFDVLVDLNRNEETFLSCCANILIAGIRIGFKKNRSEDYYNMLFDCKQLEANLAYKKLLEHIFMF